MKRPNAAPQDEGEAFDPKADCVDPAAENRGRQSGHMNFSNRSFLALQMGQTSGGPSRAHR